MRKPRTSNKEPEGLVGFFGHTYKTGEPKMLEYQFRIIRRLGYDRYVIQYFSFLDGGPTNLGVMAEKDLLGDLVKLYASEGLWNEAYEKWSRQYSRWERSEERKVVQFAKNTNNGEDDFG